MQASTVLIDIFEEVELNTSISITTEAPSLSSLPLFAFFLLMLCLVQ